MRDEVRHFGPVFRRRFELFDHTARRVESRGQRFHLRRARLRRVGKPDTARGQIARHADERAITLDIGTQQVRCDIVWKSHGRVRPRPPQRPGEHQYTPSHVLRDANQEVLLRRGRALDRFARAWLVDRDRCERIRRRHRVRQIERHHRTRANGRGAGRPRFRQSDHHLTIDQAHGRGLGRHIQTGDILRAHDVVLGLEETDASTDEVCAIPRPVDGTKRRHADVLRDAPEDFDGVGQRLSAREALDDVRIA